MEIYTYIYYIFLASRKKRLSEQQKVEKDLFPKCIQAEQKYFNKRKSEISTKKRKSTYFSDQDSLYSPSRMHESKELVKEWLEKNVVIDTNDDTSERKPFSDLPVNSPRNKRKSPTVISSTYNLRDKIRKKDVLTNIESKTKSHFINKEIFQKTVSSIREQENLDRSPKRCKKENSINKLVDESDINMEDDVVIIDDDKVDLLDKDREAFIAVIEEDKRSILKQQHHKVNETLSASKVNSLNRSDICLVNNNKFKVPFYKKSRLYFKCDNKPQISTNTVTPVTINIDKDRFLTISVYSSKISSTSTKKISQAIQTDGDNQSQIDKENFENKANLNEPNLEGSEDLFVSDDIQSLPKIKDKGVVKDSLIVEDSNSSFNSIKAIVVEVDADVHSPL